MELTGLAGARVIVTAGGSGIGRVVATRFAQSGAAVFSCDIDPALVAALGNGEPPIAATVADVSKEDDVERLFEEAVAHLGGLDVLVNNAGIGGPVAGVEAVTPVDWRRTLDVNLTGAFLCARRAIPLLKAQRSGCLIIMSSHYGLLGGPARSPYVAGKVGADRLHQDSGHGVGPVWYPGQRYLPGQRRGRASRARQCARRRARRG